MPTTKKKIRATRAKPVPKKRVTKATLAKKAAPKKHAPAKIRTKPPAKKRTTKSAPVNGRPRIPTEKLEVKKLIRRGTNKPKFKSTPRVMSDAEALAEAPNGVAVGRPRIKINWKDVKRLAMRHCPISEIASKIGVSTQTLRERPEFLTIYEQCWDLGKISVREAQFKFALNGNTAMLKWLGTFMLGQVERQEHTGPDGQPIQIDHRHSLDLTKLSDSELGQLQTLLGKAGDDTVDAEFETVPA